MPNKMKFRSNQDFLKTNLMPLKIKVDKVLDSLLEQKKDSYFQIQFYTENDQSIQNISDIS